LLPGYPTDSGTRRYPGTLDNHYFSVHNIMLKFVSSLFIETQEYIIYDGIDCRLLETEILQYVYNYIIILVMRRFVNLRVGSVFGYFLPETAV